MISNLFSKIIFLCFSIIVSYTANSKDIFALSVNFQDVYEAVRSASPGDVVFIPEGLGFWGAESQLMVPGGVSIIGRGSDKTIINRSESTKKHLIVFDGANGLPNGLYNIGFEGKYFAKDKETNNLSSGVQFMNGCVDFKVSGCKFSGFANCALCIEDAVADKSVQKGVIYQNEFIDNYYDSVNNYGYGVVVYGNGTWTDLELGTENAVFVEDNFFSGNRHHIASNNNSKYVFRYNKVEHTNPVRNYSMADAHGKSSSPVGSRSYEIYNNEFYTTNDMESRARTAIGIRGGDGVIFNNTCTDSIYRTVELWAEGFSCSTYPGIHQIRSLYIWNNEYHDELNITTEGIANNCESSIQENRDYFLQAKPGYQPYDYPHPSRNIAFNKPTSSSDDNVNHPSSIAVDGDYRLDRWWGSNSYMQWWQVDLIDVYDINKIIITPYYDGSRYYHYTIQKSIDGINWVDCITKNDQTIAIQNGDVYDNLDSIHTRFLRVKMDFNSSNASVHLIEFEAYGKQSNVITERNNIAFNKPSTSSKSTIDNPNTMATDNIFSLDNWWGTFPQDQWWQVDLMDSYKINEITITNYYGDNRYYHYSVEASQNGVDWEQIILKKDNSIATKAGNTFYFDDLSAKFLKVNMLQNSANNAVHIVEFRVYGQISLDNNKSIMETNDIYSDVLVYPNPLINDSEININFEFLNDEQNAILEIANFDGQVLLEKSIKLIRGANKLKLNTYNLSNGSYILFLKAKEHTFKKKIIISKESKN
ncbi:hypothetical protein GCM10022393_04300 [Aquimarina addita]|uniref:F5/8 type C domain-containing protein n=1 Tax=Aquimarina addita TaxID=870485 RepID=A0ABP7X9P5_9FLAO